MALATELTRGWSIEEATRMGLGKETGYLETFKSYARGRGIEQQEVELFEFYFRVLAANLPRMIEGIRIHGDKPLAKLNLQMAYVLATSTLAGNELGTFNAKPVFEKRRDKTNSNIVGLARVHGKQGQPFSADLATIREVNPKKGRPESYEGRQFAGGWRTLVGVVGDGSSMFVPKSVLSEAAPDLVETCTFVYKGTTYFRPDVPWRAALGAIVGDESMPVPDELMRNPRFKDAMCVARSRARIMDGIVEENPPKFGGAKIGMSAKELGSKLLWENIVPGLREFNRILYPGLNGLGYSDRRFHLYSSGVVGLMIAREYISDGCYSNTVEGEYMTFYRIDRSQLFGYAAVGDIGVCEKAGEQMVSCRDTRFVDGHDAARALWALGMRADQYVDVAGYRTPFTGNQPAPPNVVALMRDLGQNSPVSEGIMARPFVGVMHTDGLNAVEGGMPNLGGSKPLRGEPNEVARFIVSDPDLAFAILLLNTVNSRHPDDVGLVVLGERGQVGDNFFKTLFD